jgi:Xaa-Pro aminopeptidase
MSPSPAERLAALRLRMEQQGLDAWIVPSEDPHQSEYVPSCWRRREWISGFTGSAGFAVIGKDRAWLWADSRYWLQAEDEIDASAGWELVKQAHPETPSLNDWLASTFERGKVGVDPRTIGLKKKRDWEKALKRSGSTLELVEDDLVEAIWEGRPDRSGAPLLALDLEYSGEAPSAKLARVQAALEKENCDALVVTTLDSIAWALDLRGRDVDFNPIFISYLLIESDSATLFVDGCKLDDTVRAHLPDTVKLRAYEDFGPALDELAGRQDRVWVDPATCSAWVVQRLRADDHGAMIHEADSPITLFKACKNPVEVQGARDSHVRDGVAMVKFLCWLEAEVKARKEVSEVSAADHLEACRGEGERFQGLSFDSISGFGSHGAIVHYRPDPDGGGKRLIDDSSLYLIDSGGQYLDGTTDITRTCCFGEPTAEQRDRFTRVLKGHVALARIVFPKGTTGKHLDILARQPLWDAGLDYGHGTGHGVGAFLCVHEGPQGISQKARDVELQAGMILSNEPGYYLDGDYGIRVESLVIVEPRPEHGHSGDGREWFGFETITLCPIDRGLIDCSLLSRDELAWLDAYHARVRETLGPLVGDTERAWLEAATAPLPA